MARNFTNNNEGLTVNDLPISGYPFAISMWFRRNTAAFHRGVYIGDDTPGSGGSDYNHLMVVSNGNAIARSLGATAFEAANSSVATELNTWHNIVGVFVSDSERHIFLDGGNKGSNTVSCGTDPGNWTRFSIGIGGGQPADADIAWVGVWDDVLADAEVALLSHISPLFVRSKNLVAFVPLFGRQSPEADIVGGRQLMVTGTVTVSSPPIKVPVGPYAGKHKLRPYDEAAGVGLASGVVSMGQVGVDSSMAETFSAGLLSTGGAAVEAALQLASGNGVAPIAGVIAHAGLALALQQATLSSSSAQVVANANLDQRLGFIAAGGFLIDRALGLSASAGVGAGVLRDTAVAFELASVLGQEAAPAVTLDVAISAGAGHTLSLLQRLSYQAQLELAAAIGQAAAAALDSPGTLISVQVQDTAISVAVQGNTINIE